MVLIAGAIHLRSVHLSRLVGPPQSLNTGGDPAHHYSIARNIYRGVGPKTDFIFAYWFRHPTIPAMSDVYPPGFHYLLAAAFGVGGESPFTARMLSFACGILTLPVILLLCLELGASFFFGLFAALLVALNLVHVELSTVVMTSVAEGLVFSVALLALVHAFRVERRWWLAGAASGLATLTRGLGPALVVATFLLLVLKLVRDRRKLRRVGIAFGVYLLFYFLPQLPWIFATWAYFGRPLYSNGNFYPLTLDWSEMMFTTPPPTLKSFLESGGFSARIPSYISFIKNFGITFWNSAFPPFSSKTIAVIVKLFFFIGILRSCAEAAKGRMAILLLSILGIFALMLLAAPGNGAGVVYPRYAVLFLCLLAAASAAGWAALLQGRPRWLRNGVLLFAGGTLIPSYFIGASQLKNAPESFWTRQDLGLKDVGDWLKRNTRPDERVMFGSRPQDLAYLSDRQVVVDPNWIGGPLDAAAREVKFYGVAYLVFDPRGSRYLPERGEITADIIPPLSHYPGLEMTRLYRSPIENVYVFKVKAIE